MRFSWDRKKSEANFIERRLDFEFAAQIFDGPTVEREDTRRDYGERRVIAVGLADHLHLTVVYTDRVIAGIGVERRIISVRYSNKGERKRYEEDHEKKT